MTFYSIIKKEDIDNEKKKTLRFASEGFFWSTLFYLIALMFAFLKKTITFDFDIGFIDFIVNKIPKEIFITSIDIGLFLAILVATFYLTLQLYDILAHIGSFYEPKEEDSIRFQLKQIKRMFRNK